MSSSSLILPVDEERLLSIFIRHIEEWRGSWTDNRASNFRALDSLRSVVGLVSLRGVFSSSRIEVSKPFRDVSLCVRGRRFLSSESEKQQKPLRCNRSLTPQFSQGECSDEMLWMPSLLLLSLRKRLEIC